MSILELRGITKHFGSLAANDEISLSLAAGEILALLGENGAGKTTLMNILFGHYVADAGSIEVAGQPLPSGSTEAALEAGIGMVHQHFTLADNLSVLDNITLGTEPLWSMGRNLAAARRTLEHMSANFGLTVNADALVRELSVGERQRVEILKALYRDARILILDEPTAVLTPQESDRLFATLKNLTAKGLAIIFISHKLHEILAVSDRVTVLRRGKVVGSVKTENADRDLLAEMMVGHKVSRPLHQPMEPADPVLEVTDVTVPGEAENQALNTVDLTVRAHEIVGIAGVAGNGQRTLADLIAGLVRPARGRVALFGEPLEKASPREVVRRGTGRIPEDRHGSGVVGEMAVWENVISEELRTPSVSRWGFLIDKPACLDRADRLIEQFDVRCEGRAMQTKLLSGGNMQKLILARALSPEPRLILANQPVRGLDEGAIAYVQTQLLNARQRGAGVLLISEDLDELFALCDRIAVMYRGTLTPALPVKDLTIRDIGLLMAGQGNDARAATGEDAVHAN